jgi:hypothetical protein
MDGKKKRARPGESDEEDEIDEQVSCCLDISFSFSMSGFLPTQNVLNQALERLERLQRQRMMEMFGYDPDAEDEISMPKSESNEKKKDGTKKPQHGGNKLSGANNSANQPPQNREAKDSQSAGHSSNSSGKSKPASRRFELAPANKVGNLCACASCGMEFVQAPFCVHTHMLGLHLQFLVLSHF